MSLELTLALRYLSRRKLRSALTTLAIIFGVMVVFGLNSWIPTMMQSLQQNLLAAAGKVDLTVTSVSGEVFDAGEARRIQRVDGIAQVSGSLRRTASLPPGTYKVSALTVVGLDEATAQKVRSYTARRGRFLKAGDGDVMVIGDSLSRTIGLGTGDTIVLPSSAGSTRFRIIGVVASAAAPGIEEVYVPLAAAQHLFAIPGEINTVEAVYEPGVDRKAVQAAVKRTVGPGFRLGVLESGTQLFAGIRIGQIALNLIGLMALAMGGFIILNTFRTLVAERRRDLGMLRALGASRRTLLGVVLLESLMQGVVGTAIGIAAGAGLAYALLLLVAPVYQKYLHFSVGSPVFTLDILALSVVLGVGVTLLGGLLPAIGAGRVTPLDALRPRTAAVDKRASRRRALFGAALIAAALVGLLSGDINLATAGSLLFLLGMIVVAPALVQPIATVFGGLLTLIFVREGRLAEHNMTRQPGRSAVTTSAMMIGLAMLVMLAGILSSIFAGFTTYLDKSLGADFLLMPQSLVLSGGNVGARPALAQAVRATPDVAAATTVRLGTSQSKGAALQVIGIDPKTYPKVAGLDFSSGDGTRVFADLARGRRLIANGLFAAQNGVRRGDVLALETPSGRRRYRVAGIASDYLNAKLSTVVVSQANLARDFHETADLLVMANMTKRANAAAVRADLGRIIKRYPAFTLYSSAEWRQSQLDVFAASMSMFYGLMAIFALPSLLALLNTLAINVIERTREIGMVRAIGGTRRQVRRMILAESLLLASAGIAFGILAGLWLGYVLAGLMNVSGFKIPYYFPYTGVLMTIAVGLLFGVVASLIPARQAARLDIVKALQYE